MSGLSRSFGQVSSEVIRDPNISSTAKAVYACLATYADNKTGLCWVSNTTLASDLGVSVPTVERAIHELGAAGVLRRQARYTDEGRQTTSSTRLCDIRTDRAASSMDRFLDDETSPTLDRPLADDGYVPITGEGHVPITGEGQNYTTKNKTTRNTRTSAVADTSDDGAFAEWWAAYPKKVGKKAAEREYAKALRTTTPTALLVALHAQLPGMQARIAEAKGDKRYILDPRTWLFQGHWDDDVSPVIDHRTREQRMYDQGWR